jgi:hypothetical protein
MRQILLIVTAVLLVLVLSVAVAGCRKSSGKKGGGGYLPGPYYEHRASYRRRLIAKSTSRRSCGLGEGPDRPSGTLCGTSPQVR